MKLYVLILTLLIAPVSNADTKVDSQFGFSANLPDGWFVLSPQQIAAANQNASAESVGIPDTVDSRVSSEIIERIRGGNIEFFYDGNYIDEAYNNHVSAQLSGPLQVRAMADPAVVAKECEAMPDQLNEIFGEKVDFLSCEVIASNGRPVYHHAYTVESQGVTIINEVVPVNEDYSLMFVGGSANDIEGLHRVRAAQQILVDAATRMLSGNP